VGPMSDHLPECEFSGCGCGNEGFPSCTCPDCICDNLRACEARVAAGAHVLIVEAHSSGLDAAREAVAAVEEEYVGDEFKQGGMALRVALAAIDALREPRWAEGPMTTAIKDALRGAE
jgi:hypothetical protein